jgi:RHS repeat-associated protein
VFRYDTSGNLLAETSGSGTPIRTYVWREAASGPLAETLLDHPVAQIEHANNGNLGGSNGTATEAVLYLRTDELATPREARNAAGTVVWSWYSAAFGDTSAAEDTDGNGQRTIVNLRFPGQYADQEAGLHYNWHRSYDPATGRYLESDPIGIAGGINTYLYGRSNPLVQSDPTGQESVPNSPRPPGVPECLELPDMPKCGTGCIARCSAIALQLTVKCLRDCRRWYNYTHPASQLGLAGFCQIYRARFERDCIDACISGDSCQQAGTRARCSAV